MMRFIILASLLCTHLAFATDDWQLLCIEGSSTGCHSLWKTVAFPKPSSSTLLISYNVEGDSGHLKPSIVIDLDHVQVAPNSQFLTLAFDQKVQMQLPIVAINNDGVMASDSQLYTLNQILTELQMAKTTTVTFTEKNAKTPTHITIDMQGFNNKLTRMLHGDALLVKSS